MTMANLTTVISKTAGGLGLAAVAYDAHKLAKVRAGEYRRNAIANSGLDAYMDSKQLNKPSVLLSKAQDKRFDMEMKGHRFNGIRNAFNSAKGYIKGLGESLVHNVVPFALSAVALLTKGPLSKASSIGLTAYALVDVTKNVICAGKTHFLK